MTTPTPKTAREELREEIANIIRDEHGGRFGEADAILSLVGKRVVGVVEGARAEWEKGSQMPDDLLKQISQPLRFRQDCLCKMEACEENIVDLRELLGVKE